MIYKTRDKILLNGNSIELGDLEHRFLVAISDENLTLLKDISNFVYGYINFKGVRMLKYRLCKKAKLNITTIINLGYKLEDVILFK